MELYEFHVGESGAGAMRDGVSVPGRYLRIRRVAIDLSAPTRRQHRRIADNLYRFSGDRGSDPENHPVFGNQIENAGLLENLDPPCFLDAFDQSARHFGAGLISVCVHDSPARVSSFTAEFEVPSRL